MIDDHERCYRALQARNPRFDGWFFVAVTSSGIYGRPSCPTTTPKREHVRFYPSAAAAQRAGFRACKRCRPDLAPGSPEWDRRDDLAARAARLIADGAVDRGGVRGLAAEVGCTVAELDRLLMAELGAGPLALARAQRAQTARTLIESTSLPMAEISSAAGFDGVRQLSDTLQAVFARTAGALRGAPGRTAAGLSRELTLQLWFRRPLCPENLFGHLAATAVPGVEECRDDTYRRALRLAHGTGIAELTPRLDHVACRLILNDLRDLGSAIARCRWLLDLDSDPDGVDRDLARDPDLRRLVRRAPGRRIPRTVDGAELAIRAVIGQQITTAAARTAAGRLAAEFGEPVNDPRGTITRQFPTPEALIGARLPGPAARARTFAALVGALCERRLSVDIASDRKEARAELGRLPGIGPWTTEIVAMRALGDPDAFPASDLGVRRAAESLGLPSKPAALIARAQGWRPWRAYAVQYLWSATEHPINRWPRPSGA